MTKRIISMLLAVIMMASAFVFTSCIEEMPERHTEAPETDAEGELVRAHNVPKTDFDGETFNSLCYKMNTTNYYYFTDEEAAGDPIKEALWKRTELIAEHLNCELTADMREGNESEMVCTVLYDEVMADLDSYQQVLLHTIIGVDGIVSNGYAYDFAKLPYVDLTADWWDLDDMETLRLGKIYPYGRSDFVISAPHVVTFNKDLVEELGLENPYKLVDNHTWVLDTMLEMALAAVLDVNNDAKFKSDTDRYGIVTSEDSKFNSFLTSCDQPVSRKNYEGRLEIVLNTEKTVSIIEKFYELQKIKGSLHLDIRDMRGVHMDGIFGEGRALFALYDLSFLELLRVHDVNYGIVPYPKYDEKQKEYRSQDWGPMWMVPRQVKNSELVGSVVELYSYYSDDTIVPAYYDKVLDGKLSNDLDSRRMLDIIFESVSFDPVTNYFGFHSGIGGLPFVIAYLTIGDQSKDFASYYREREMKSRTVLREFYSNLRKNGGI